MLLLNNVAYYLNLLLFTHFSRHKRTWGEHEWILYLAQKVSFDLENFELASPLLLCLKFALVVNFWNAQIDKPTV